MAKNYQDRRNKEPWQSVKTFRHFWLRRFFRIAPLYYLLLIVALAFGHWFGEMREFIASAWPSTTTPDSRYAARSLTNIISHLTFAFGFIPAWSYRTVLPDWSIGLEMQFYLLFPFIMLLIMRLSFCVSSLLLMTGCLAARWLLPGYFDAFPMPSMILIKLPLFVAGMLISQAVRIQKIQYLAPVVAWQMRLAVNPLRLISECAMIVGLAVLLWNHQKMTKLSVLAGVPKRWFTHPVSQFLGDVSYSVYLLHLMLVIPTVGLLIHYTNFASEPALVRFSEVAVLSLPVTYLLAFVLYRKVEKSGIALGKRFISKDATQPERVIP